MLLAFVSSARAERGLVSPSNAEPARVAPGGVLELRVEVAAGLTPPPGIQEDRAHRAFSISLCASGLDLGAGARRCFPLRVANVRPVDAASLVYRVEAAIPIWLAPWRYDLSLRFPGGSAEALGAVAIASAGDDLLSANVEALVDQRGSGWTLAAARSPVRVRLHVGAAGVWVQGAALEPSPLPDTALGFAPGFVGLLRLRPGQRVSVTKRQAKQAFALQLDADRAEAGRPTRLSASGGGPGARLFWWLGTERGALGFEVTTTFLYPGEVEIQVLAVTSDGRAELLRKSLPIWQRRAFGCAVGRGRAALAPLWLLGLLLFSRWWTSRRPAPPTRPEVC